MLTRRNFSISLAASVGTSALAKTPRPELQPDHHAVLMLNADCNDANVINVFEPPILHVAAGDRVTFLSTDAGHNTASKRGMIPEGADPWNTDVDANSTLTFTVPGVYGYVCVPHYEFGMVGLIIVGDDYSNLKQAKSVRHVGDARTAFRRLFKDLEKETG